MIKSFDFPTERMYDIVLSTESKPKYGVFYENKGDWSKVYIQIRNYYLGFSWEHRDYIAY